MGGIGQVQFGVSTTFRRLALGTAFLSAVADRFGVWGFDEEARELTVEAARQAGLQNLTLLEEPLAAFYAWVAEHQDVLGDYLRDGEFVLVCDIGGGTSDRLRSLSSRPRYRTIDSVTSRRWPERRDSVTPLFSLASKPMSPSATERDLSEVRPFPWRRLKSSARPCPCANEESRYTLNGALMVLKQESITLVATDGAPRWRWRK